MRLFRLASIALIALPLGGCGVPDLVAHGVKNYENSRDTGRAQTAPATTPAPVASTAPAPPEPPPAEVGPMPQRTEVTVEKLK